MVFVTFAASTTRPLSEARTALGIVEAMARMGHRYGVGVAAYCIMPDHLHAVVQIAGEGADLRKWVRYTKRQCARALQMPGMWQRSYWDRHARADDDVGAMVEYVLANPVRRGLVADWQEWPWSWSRWHPQTRGPAPDAA